MNFQTPSTQSIFIKHLHSILILRNHTQKVSIKSFFPYKYKVYIFQICLHMKIMVYILLD